MNRLARERSPYLRQHADNPVAWYPWGEEAFAAARERDVPILLSIGYASCHWCHVMAHESFEDPEMAELLNERFVNVKVDREERPDVDAIYMTALQAMRGQGGWPLTVWLDPAGKPLYAGTYFPPDDRPGMPSFRRAAHAISQAWTVQRDALLEDADRLADHVRQSMDAVPGDVEGLGEDPAEAALRALDDRYDAAHGGFGGAPKFPPHGVLRWLLLRDEPRARELASGTLRGMAHGGLFDQLGGGFARYTVDARWHVPHFEKMLYDNAELLGRYAEAHHRSGDEAFRATALGVVDWLAREMRLEGGGLASGLDADSEGEEGRYYVWTREAFDAAAGEHAELARAAYGVGTVGELEGLHVLRRAADDRALAERFDLSVDAVSDRLERARIDLLAAREKRERPALDDKVLTGWNGLAIRGLARAARLLDHPPALSLAQDAAGFLLREVRRDGRLWRRWHGGEVAVEGMLEDHAFLGLGLLELHRADGDPAWLEAAVPLADEILERFADPEGGFRSTPADGETLLARPRSLIDGAVPSDSVAAAELLWRVGRLTGRRPFEEAAERTVAPLSDAAAQHPDAFGHALTLLELMRRPPREAALLGPAERDDTESLWRELAARPLDDWTVQRAEAGSREWPLLEGRGPVDGRTAAYLCERYACRRPITDVAELREALPAG